MKIKYLAVKKLSMILVGCYAALTSFVRSDSLHLEVVNFISSKTPLITDLEEPEKFQRKLYSPETQR